MLHTIHNSVISWIINNYANPICCISYYLALDLQVDIDVYYMKHFQCEGPEGSNYSRHAVAMVYYTLCFAVSSHHRKVGRRLHTNSKVHNLHQLKIGKNSDF